jgi:3-isopropylmalate/(R)-2-methylmalate dehydratase small subunit
MTAPLSGRAWVFAGRVTTDDVLPGRYLEKSADEVAQYAMAGLDPEFARKVRPGDFVVGGDEFGAGSGRENAIWALKNAGVAAVLATKIARSFHRNCVNLGLPALAVDGLAAVVTGDALVVDLAARLVRPARGAEVLPIRNLTGISLEILEAGGIVPYTLARRDRLRQPSEESHG